MEAFAKERGVRTVWSNQVAHLQSNGTRAVVTALVMQSREQPKQMARGVRIDLSRPSFWPFYARDHIYLDEPAAERTRAALEEIAGAIANDHRTAGRGCMGAREFWPLYNWPWNKYHELNADICTDAKSMSLVLVGRGKRKSFQFPNQSADSFAAVLTTAIGELKQQ